MSVTEDQVVMLSSTNHISDVDLILYLENKLSEKQIRDTELHLAECDNCLANLANIHNLQKQISSDTSSPAINFEMLERAKNFVNKKEEKIRTDWISAPSLNFAATISAIVVFGIFVTAINFSSRTLHKVPGAFRSLDTTHTFAMIHPEDGEILSNNHPIFSWDHVDNAASYQLRIFLENGSLYWQTNLTDTSLILPSNVILVPGSRYLWQVEGLMPDERTIHSKLESFTYSGEKAD